MQSIRYVKDAFINTGSGVMDFIPTVEALKPNILVVNSDGGNEEKRRFCEEHGIQYVVLERTPHVVQDPSTGSGTALKARSSTDLKKTESQIPTRLDLAGTWIDQPYVSQYAPGWAITISLEPTLTVVDLCRLDKVQGELGSVLAAPSVRGARAVRPLDIDPQHDQEDLAVPAAQYGPRDAGEARLRS